jgi:hypothetical protein
MLRYSKKVKPKALVIFTIIDKLLNGGTALFSQELTIVDALLITILHYILNLLAS